MFSGNAESADMESADAGEWNFPVERNVGVGFGFAGRSLALNGGVKLGFLHGIEFAQRPFGNFGGLVVQDRPHRYLHTGRRDGLGKRNREGRP